MGKVIDKSVDEQIHNGRREKLRQSFKKYGLETFNETQVLEFALGMTIPRIDTNPTAHRLINTFGSLDGVISASVDKLTRVPGVGVQSANFLHFLKQFQIYMHGLERKTHNILTPADAVETLREVMKLYPVEHFIVVCLDVRGDMILHQNIRGDIDRVNISVREVVDAALRVGTQSLVFAHNHPDGNATPSAADISLTRTLVGIFQTLGINIIDHVIFGSGRYYSFAENGIIEQLRREHKNFTTSRPQ
jgi:DNA repair protein RadC